MTRRSAFPGFDAVGDGAARRRALVARLVAERQALGITQAEIAARMGTSQPAVARLEAGGLDARLSTVDRYADALGRRLDWQLSNADDRSDP